MLDLGTCWSWEPLGEQLQWRAGSKLDFSDLENGIYPTFPPINLTLNERKEIG